MYDTKYKATSCKINVASLCVSYHLLHEKMWSLEAADWQAGQGGTYIGQQGRRQEVHG